MFCIKQIRTKLTCISNHALFNKVYVIRIVPVNIIILLTKMQKVLYQRIRIESFMCEYLLLIQLLNITGIIAYYTYKKNHILKLF